MFTLPKQTLPDIYLNTINLPHHQCGAKLENHLVLLGPREDVKIILIVNPITSAV